MAVLFRVLVAAALLGACDSSTAASPPACANLDQANCGTGQDQCVCPVGTLCQTVGSHHFCGKTCNADGDCPAGSLCGNEICTKFCAKGTLGNDCSGNTYDGGERCNLVICLPGQNGCAAGSAQREGVEYYQCPFAN
jgi:hypothetical protein